jgi:outer membrane protein assembly factor BamB|tara:strand:+ start:14227 stop:15429 length:1203 start_codon:yes stop_codon:yes gene_type:complete
MRLARAFFPIAVLAFAGVMSACSSTPEKVLPDVTGDTDISVSWRTSLGEGPGVTFTRLKAAVGDGVVYAADTGGQVSAINLESGRHEWSVDLEQTILGGVALAGDQLFVSLREGSLVALSTDNGEELWRSMLPSEAVAMASADEQRVFVQTVDGRVTALEREDGKQAWSYEAGMPVLSIRGTGAPLVLERLVLTGFATGKLVALDKVLGIPRWDVRLGVPDGRSELERLVDVDGAPVGEGRIIYAAAYHGNLAAISENGDVIWQESGSSYTSPELALGSIYLTLDDDTIQSYDMVTGAQAWKQDQLQGRGLGQVTAIGTQLAVGDEEGYVHFLSQVDGEVTGRILLRPRPLHINYPHQGEATNWRLSRGRDFGIRSNMVETDEGLLVYTNAGELLLLDVK